MSSNFRGNIKANQRKTWLLMFTLFILLSLTVSAFGFFFGLSPSLLLPVAVLVAVLTVWFAYWNSTKIVLSLTGAKPVNREQAPALLNLVEEMALASGIPVPQVAIVTDLAPNAYATGRDPNNSIIVYTTGILEIMDREQLQGVTAHEMAHIANRDTLVMTVAATTVGLLALLSDIGLRVLLFSRSDNRNPLAAIALLVAVILAPLAGLLMRASISRKREALADASAVSYTRNPAGLRRALELLDANDTVVQSKSNAVAHLWIESPLDKKKRSLFNTHQPLQERISILRAME
jgi:heat shock protein HtpX